MKKNISKILASILCAATLMTNASTVMADSHWRFDFKKGQNHSCGPVSKPNTTSMAKISMLSSDNPYFVVNSSKLDVVIKDIYGFAATPKYVYTNYGTTFHNYIQHVPQNSSYNLHGNVDPGSGTEWIRVGGYWQP